MQEEPTPVELDLGAPSAAPPPRRSRRGWIMGGAGLVTLLALVVRHGEPPAPPPPAPVAVEEAPVDTGAPPEEEATPPPRRPRPAPVADVAPEAAAPPEAPAEESPPVEPVVLPADELAAVADELKKVGAVLKARNYAAAEKMAEERLTGLFDKDKEATAEAMRLRRAARSAGAVVGKLGTVNARENPYAAAELVTEALERLEPVGFLRPEETATLNRVAGMLGAIGEAIVDQRDEARYPLARRALEAANRWSARADGVGEYTAKLATLEERAQQAVARAQAKGESPGAVARWAPTGGVAARQLRQMEGGGG